MVDDLDGKADSDGKESKMQPLMIPLVLVFASLSILEDMESLRALLSLLYL